MKNETKRLLFREMTREDLPSLRLILQDEKVMYAYEHAFLESEVEEWLAKQMTRYVTDFCGLMAVILKETGEFIGQCGITKQRVNEEILYEVGYLFGKKYWNKGYATEAATYFVSTAYRKFDIQCVYAIIRDNNIASLCVAKKLGMTIKGKIVKQYYNLDMPHLVYGITRQEFFLINSK